MSTEIKEIQTDIQEAFSELKHSLKEKVKEEVKGYVDPLISEKIDRINDAITKAEDRLDAAERVEKQLSIRNEVENQVKRSEVDEAFLQYVRNEKRLSTKQYELLETNQKALSSFSDSAGGYLVVPFIDTAITRALTTISSMRTVATVKNISTDTYIKPSALGSAEVYWADRDHEPVETGLGTYGNLTIRVNKLVAYPKISEDLLEDAVIDIAAEVVDAITNAFSEAEEAAFVAGDGVGQPLGILSLPAGTTFGTTVEQIPSLDANLITTDALTNLVYGLGDAYAANARFMMRSATVGAIRKLTDETGNALWTPAYGTEPATIMGYPVVRNKYMPAVAAGALPIAFGDFRRGYIVVDRRGVRVLRDPYTSKPFVKFYTTKRVGGGVDNTEAYKLLKIAAS